MATLLMYLSDVEEGGETVFPRAKATSSFLPKHTELSQCGQKGIAVNSKMGNTLLFWSLFPNATVDGSALHEIIMAFQIGQPGVSAFLQTILRDLDAVIQFGDFQFLPVNTELKEVKSLLLEFEDVLLDGERKRQLGNKGAGRWMDDLKDLFYDIDDLVDEIRMEKQQLQQEITDQPSSSSKVSCNFSDCFHTAKNFKYRLDQALDAIGQCAKEASRLELKRDLVQHDAIWLASHAKFRPKQGCFADEAMIHGREDEKNKIIEMLLRNDGEEISKSKRSYEVVCVVGMGGLGKTTLAQLVFQDERIKSFFTVMSWACVSDVVDVIKLIQDLRESAAENDKNSFGASNMPSGLSALQARLKKIVNDQKFLLVLDDVWTTKEWKELNAPLNFGAKGSKILVTTRLNNVAEDLGNKEPYLLGKLQDAECLKILNDNAFEEGDRIDTDEDLMKIREKIAKKCKGVPLVAKVIGSLLRGEDKGKWKAVKNNDIWNLAYEDEDLHPGLRLSYFYLPPFLKRCFEYFALFPSDFWFRQSDLVRMWIAEGLIEVKEEIEPEEIGDQYYNDLKGRSLIQDDNKIHDMVHHLACIVSGTSFFRGFSGSHSSASSMQRVRHAYIRNKPEVLIHANKLRTLFHQSQFCRESFSCKELKLRVVKVSTSTPTVSYLQNLIRSDLKHLRYLQIRGNFANNILPNSFSLLTNLQVLDIWYDDLKNLPQDIGMLSNLRYLELGETGITSLPDSVCSLSNLRVLDIFSNKCLTSLPKNIGNLRSLRKLVIGSGTPVSSLPESLLNATNLCVLDISHSVILPAHIGKLTQLERLNCYGIGKEEGRGIVELKDMNKLKGGLSMVNMENIDCVEDALMANLKSKKHIKRLQFVWKKFDAALTGRDGEIEMRVLEALEPNAAIESLSFRNFIGNKLPSWMSTAPLHNLTSLILFNILAITEMVGMEFKSLQSLELSDCPALRLVSIMTTAKLKELRVEKCKELKPASLLLLPPPWDALETLKVDYYHLNHFVQQIKSENASPCTQVKDLSVLFGGDDDEITSLPVGWPTIFTSLQYLGLYDLPPTNFNIISEDEDESSSVTRSEQLVSIRELYICCCPRLLSLEFLELPPRLEDLGILDCPILRNLPYGLCDLTSLKFITIADCPIVEIRPHHPLPASIKYKSIRNCPKLEEQLVCKK